MAIRVPNQAFPPTHSCMSLATQWVCFRYYGHCRDPQSASGLPLHFLLGHTPCAVWLPVWLSSYSLCLQHTCLAPYPPQTRSALSLNVTS